MAVIDTCMIQKFVQRSWQIHKFPFDDKEFVLLGCSVLPAMERNYYFLPAFLFKPVKLLILGVINHFTLTSFKIMCHILPNKLNWWHLIHWAQQMSVFKAEHVFTLSVFFVAVHSQTRNKKIRRVAFIQLAAIVQRGMATQSAANFICAAARARNRQGQLPIARIHRRPA